MLWLPHARGVNASWLFPCHCPLSSSSPLCLVCANARRDRNETNVCDAVLEGASTLRNWSKGEVCFRGVHDGLVSSMEVEEALRLGAQLIRQGGDHFDIHRDSKLLLMLNKSLPRLLVTLRSLLRDSYLLDRASKQILQPVAFRISGAAPMDGIDVNVMESLHHVLNLTVRSSFP